MGKLLRSKLSMFAIQEYLKFKKAMLLVGVLLLFSPFSANGNVSVAFFEAYDQMGKLIQLEPKGRFYHVAISYRYGWIHSSPKGGVQRVDSLETIGKPAVILTNTNLTSVSLQTIKPYLKLPFDFNFRWDNPRATYCSKLVAQILGLEPRPMSFSARYWNNSYAQRRGDQIGLSPDDLFEILSKQGFQVDTILLQNTFQQKASLNTSPRSNASCAGLLRKI